MEEGSSYQWRIHPPPTAALDTNYPSCKKNGISNTKFRFRQNDDVYIRPKSAKELGISGRIVDIIDAAGCETGASSTHTHQASKKRKLVEDVRASVQQHCFNRKKNCNRIIKTGVRPSRLFPVYDIEKGDQLVTPPQPLVILTPDTTNYRQLATSHLRSSDKALEIGNSTGECTVLLLRRLILQHAIIQQEYEKDDDNVTLKQGHIVAFDTGSDMIEQAKKRLATEYENHSVANSKDDDGVLTTDNSLTRFVQFHKVDAFADPKGTYSYATQGSSSNTQHPDMVLIDIGGNRELDGVVRMIRWVQSVFERDPPRVIIVKSESLVEELSSSTGACEGNKAEQSNEVGQSTKPTILEDGTINLGQEWFSSLISSSDDMLRGNKETSCATLLRPRKQNQSAPKYSHPIKAPLVLSPRDNSTPICRFHNYHPDGCKRYNNDRSDCPYDHDHCHWCREAGHVALNCNH